MTTKKPTTPAQTEADAIIATSAIVDAVVTATVKPTTPVIDLKAARTSYDAAVLLLKSGETRRNSAMLDMVAPAANLRDAVRPVATVFFSKNTPATLKARCMKVFPVLGDATGIADAVFAAFAQDAGIGRSTARNLLQLADKPELLEFCRKGHDGVLLPVSAAYRLAAESALTVDDWRAATSERPNPAMLTPWITARLCAKTICAQWPVYSAGTAAIDAATDDEARKTARASAGAAWQEIARQYATMRATGFDALATINPDVSHLVADEMTARLAAVTAKAEAAKTEAARLAEIANTETTAATTATARQKEIESEIKTATTRQSELEKAIDAKKAEMDKAEESALAQLKVELKTLTDAATTARVAANAALELRKAADADAATATKRAATATSAAASAAAISAAATATATVEQALTPARPTAGSYDALLAIYKRMNREALAAEIKEIAAEVSATPGGLVKWAATGRAIALGLTG